MVYELKRAEFVKKEHEKLAGMPQSQYEIESNEVLFAFLRMENYPGIRK